MSYELPKLDYAYDALEPHLDAQTMELHHSKHHQGYVNGLNTALEKLAQARDNGDFAGVKNLEADLAFHGSGHVLHSIFWTNMSPDGGGEATGDIAKQIEKDFGGFDKFQGHFLNAANTVVGSGWGILGWHKDLDRLLVLQAEKHNDLTVQGVTPLLVVDVWEHAYYLKYQNKRPEYTSAFMNVVNWDNVNERFLAARG